MLWARLPGSDTTHWAFALPAKHRHIDTMTNAFLIVLCFLAHGQVSIKQAKGWFESAYITWDLYNGADMYNVYVKKSGAASWTQLDEELIRNYGWYGRADALGLAAGNYQFKVEAVKSGSVIAGSAAESGTVAVASYDRAGFAHKDGDAVGAYNSDGTLKANARVLYITNENIDNVTLTVMQDKEDTEFTGLGNILKAFEKGKGEAEEIPLARFIKVETVSSLLVIFFLLFVFAPFSGLKK